MKHKIYNAIYGAIIGDALGVPFEFTDRSYLKNNPVTDMIGFGTYNFPKGTWSDDTSMTLCLAESIGRLKCIDYDDVMKNFLSWYKHAKFTPDKKVFDIGKTCLTSILNYCEKTKPIDCGLSDDCNNGNGSLMRISPLPFYLFHNFGIDAMDKDEVFEIIHNVSRLTHGHAVSLIGCDIYCAYMLEILKGTKEKNALLGYSLPKIGAFVRNNPEYTEAFQRYERIFHLDFKELREDEIKSSGYIVDTLEAAIWCFLITDNYRDCVLKAVNLGHDADTVACVAGSIAGLYYEEIPADWIKNIRNRKLVDKIIDEFSNAVC